jgi:hypothetical protein
MGRVAGRFARADLRRRARAFVRGLLADLPRKNCWTIAEHAGHPNPDGMQHLLARAVWDHEGSTMTCAAMSWSTSVIRERWCPQLASMPRPLSRTRCAATCPTRPHEPLHVQPYVPLKCRAMPGFVAGPRHSLVTRPMSGSLGDDPAAPGRRITSVHGCATGSIESDESSRIERTPGPWVSWWRRGGDPSMAARGQKCTRGASNLPATLPCIASRRTCWLSRPHVSTCGVVM